MSSRGKPRILSGALRAFLERGYVSLSMSELADLCGLTRRGLYHHFSSKEELFRAVLRQHNASATMNGDEAAYQALQRDDSAVDVLALWLDARFGATRRDIAASPFGRELNDTAFRIATDIMIELSFQSNRKLADLVTELCIRERLRLRDGMTADRLGGLLADGARGVNQGRPPVPNDQLLQRYKDVVAALLYGCAEPEAT